MNSLTGNSRRENSMREIDTDRSCRKMRNVRNEERERAEEEKEVMEEEKRGNGKRLGTTWWIKRMLITHLFLLFHPLGGFDSLLLSFSPLFCSLYFTFSSASWSVHSIALLFFFLSFSLKKFFFYKNSLPLDLFISHTPISYSSGIFLNKYTTTILTYTQFSSSEFLYPIVLTPLVFSSFLIEPYSKEEKKEIRLK